MKFWLIIVPVALSATSGAFAETLCDRFGCDTVWEDPPKSLLEEPGYSRTLRIGDAVCTFHEDGSVSCIA